MIKEAYCSFEVAKLLKEKGFNEPCRAVYEEEILRINTLCDYYNSELSSYVCALTHQMAMKWLMDNYNLFFKPEPIMTKYGELKWVINIYNISIYYVDLNSFEHLNTTVKCNSLYDAIEKALKHSLKYLVKKC